MKKIEDKKVVVVECNGTEVDAVNERTETETKITAKKIEKGSLARILDGNNDKFIIHLKDNSKNAYYQIICTATEERL